MTTADELTAAYQELEGGSDRAIAIVGMALVDERIQSSICGRFIGDLPARKNFFKPDDNGVWDAFTKIRLAYLLGVYSENTKENLKALNTIRNRFAHRINIHNFEHGDLNFSKVNLHRRYAEIQKSKKPRDKLIRLLLPEEPLPSHPTRRQIFIASVKLLLAYLYQDAVTHVGADTNPEF